MSLLGMAGVESSSDKKYILSVSFVSNENGSGSLQLPTFPVTPSTLPVQIQQFSISTIRYFP